MVATAKKVQEVQNIFQGLEFEGTPILTARSTELEKKGTERCAVCGAPVVKRWPFCQNHKALFLNSKLEG